MAADHPGSSPCRQRIRGERPAWRRCVCLQRVHAPNPRVNLGRAMSVRPQERPGGRWTHAAGDPRTRTSSAPSRSSSRQAPALWRRLRLPALAAGGAVVLYLLRPGALTDDSYAFLDWGRDLRHGYLPLLEHRTFHPLPIVAGALVSLLGSAAPTIAVLLTLAGLVLLAVAAWRAVEILGFPQPAPALAALLVLSSPLLSLLAQVAYINLPFAALVLWALVFELEGRSRRAWVLLITAGLVRPEGWAFLLAYAALQWWRAGRPRAPRSWLALAALSLGPMALWLMLEWRLFGDPLYSFNNTRAPNVQATGSGSVSGLWNSLQFSVVRAPLVAAAVGAVAVARLAPRRAAAVVLGTTGVAVLTVLALASSKFNVPSRQFSALVPLLYILAAAGAATPARLLAQYGIAPPPVRAATAAAGAALVAGLAVAPTISLLRRNSRTVRVAHALHGTLDQALARSAHFVDVNGAQRHTVALVGAVDDSQVVWHLGVPYNVVTDAVGRGTRMIVEPSESLYSRLGPLGLTDRTRLLPPPRWRLVVATSDWRIWVLGRHTPVRLR
jgi:hypothetical protein